MLGYRAFPYIRGARATQRGHPLYLPPQGAGRFDNPDRYKVWYLASDPTTAVIETFAALAWWTPAMFEFPAAPGAHYRLASIELPERTQLSDFDDPEVLAALRTRPTAVMSSDRRVTQALAAAVHQRDEDGIRWWSTWPEHRPLLAVWNGQARVRSTEVLHLDHDAVIAAAGVLAKPVRLRR